MRVCPVGVCLSVVEVVDDDAPVDVDVVVVGVAVAVV